MNIVVDAEKEVLERYAEASTRFEPELCCAVQYDPKFLAAIPEEVIEKDYGCGDPSQFIREGEVVLDLGSGTGKICFIAAQIVGPNGHVIGVDFNPAMLELARRHQPTVAANIGHDNVTFKYGKIQDLKTDYDLLPEWVNGHRFQLRPQPCSGGRQTVSICRNVSSSETRGSDCYFGHCLGSDRA